MGRPQRILEHMGAPGQPLEKELRGGIADCQIPAHAVAPAPAGEHVHRLGEARPVVGELQKLVVAVARHHEPHDQFVAQLEHRPRGHSPAGTRAPARPW